MSHHLENLIYGARQIEEVIWNIELVVLKLGQIQQIIYKIFHHFLRVNLRLQ